MQKAEADFATDFMCGDLLLIVAGVVQAQPY
jgi:hypothetical protein